MPVNIGSKQFADLVRRSRNAYMVVPCNCCSFPADSFQLLATYSKKAQFDSVNVRR